MADDLAVSDMALLESTLAAPPAADPVADASVAVDDTPNVADSIDSAIADETAKAGEPAADPAKPVEDPAATTDPKVDDKGAEPAKPAVEPEVDLTSDDLTVKALNERIAKSPEFKAIVDKDPELKKQLFYAARRGERATQYDEMFQTPALAKDAKAAADELYTFKDTYSSNPDEALKHMFAMTIQKDDKGEYMRGADGRILTNGSFEKTMAVHRAAYLAELSKMAEQLGEGNFGDTDITQADLQEAIKIFQSVEAHFGFGAKPAGAPAPKAATKVADLPADVQAKLAELDDIKRGQATNSAQSLDTFRSSVNDAVGKALEADVKGLLDSRLPANAAMSDYTKNAIIRDTLSEVDRLAKANMAHRSMFERSLRSTKRDDAGVKSIVDFERAYAREIFPRILSRLLSQNATSIVAQNASDRAKVGAQANRKEVASSGGVTAPSRPDVKARAREIDQAARAKGKILSDYELVDAVMNDGK